MQAKKHLGQSISFAVLLTAVSAGVIGLINALP